MEFTRPTFLEFVQTIINRWRTKRDNIDTGPGSDVEIDAHGIAHIGDSLHSHAVAVKKDLYPGSASRESLSQWLADLGQPDGQGYYGRIQADGSSGTNALRVTCTAAPATVTTTDTLKDAANNLHRPTGTTNWTGTGDKDISIEAISTGYSTNREIGDTLEFLNAPTGIQEEATLIADLDGGRDLQTDTEGRAAAVDYLRAPSISGNWPEWRRKVNEAGPGLYESFVYNGRGNYPFGYGCVDVAILQVGERWSNRVITEDQETAIWNYLSGETGVPYLLLQHLRILGYGGLPAPYTGSVSTVEKTIELEIELGEGAPSDKACSWDAQDEKRYITAEDEGNLLITVNSAYTTGPQSGEFVFIDGEEAEVDLEPGNASAPVSGSMLKFTVKEWPWTLALDTGRPSGGGFYVMSGGGLISTIWEALQDYINSIGPAKGPSASPQAGWDDTIRIDFLKRFAANAGEGWIVDFPVCLIGGAATDGVPTYTVTNVVELMIDDGIVVWEKK